MNKLVNNSWQLGLDQKFASCSSSLNNAVQRLANVIDKVDDLINGVSIQEQVVNLGDNEFANITGKVLRHDLSGWYSIGKGQGSQKGNDEDLSLHFEKSNDKFILDFENIF